MSLKTSKKVETNVYELEITVDAATFEEAVTKAYNKMKNRINVPGFRTGKAPRSMLTKLYGNEIFYDEALDIVYPDAVEGAVKEAGLEIVDAPFDVEIVEVGENGAEMKLKVTVTPEVELGNYKNLEVEKAPVVVTDEEFSAQMDQVLERNARFISATDRAAADGDMVTIDFEGFVDGEAFEGGKAENYDLTIGSNSFIPGFEEQIVGHNVEEEFDIAVKFPEEYAEQLAGKDATFKIKINAIKQKELPELNDDFAKDVSEFDTLKEYQDDLRAQIEQHKQQEADAEVENQLLDQLVELVVAEIPPVMIERQMDQGVNDLANQMQSQGLTLDTYLQFTGSTKEDLRESMREQAEKQVKVKLALDKIAQLEKIEVTEELLEEQYQKLAEMYGIEADIVKKAIPAQEAGSSIKNEQAIAILKDNAKVVEKKPEAEDEAKKPAAKKAPAKKAATKKADADAEEKPADEKAEKKPAAKKAPAKKPAAKKTTPKEDK